MTTQPMPAPAAIYPPPPYTTSDLGLASFLVASGYPMKGITKSNGQRRYFWFDGAAAEQTPGFYSGALVPARALVNALRDLKTLLRET